MKELIAQVQEIIYYLRIQNYHEGGMRFRRLLSELPEEERIARELQKAGSFTDILAQMLETLEREDMVLLGDVLEEALLPALKEYVCHEEEEQRENYSLEATSSGYLTIRHLPTGLYLHANTNPMEEARILVARCFDAGKERYAIWGCGLGYHVKRLYEAARGAVTIAVFEEDEQLVELAEQRGVLQEIPRERLSVFVDKTGEKFAAYAAEKDTGLLLHLPSIRKIENSQLREALQSFFASWNGTIQYKEELTINFRSNVLRCSHNVEELAELFKGREAVIVGAGPSLDSSLDYLRKIKGKRSIIAATTVLKKLLELGIEPDYAVVMDSQARTIGHIRGIEESQVPLILDSTAYWEFADSYQGEKYLAMQKYYGKAEEYARKHGLQTYETGGSVVTLALEILLRLGVRKIHLVGVDLAYPEGLSHAENTMDRSKRDIRSMERVRSVNGGWVYADVLFNSYRKWIEEKIRQYPQVAFYNHSDCGAVITGAEAYCTAKGEN